MAETGKPPQLCWTCKDFSGRYGCPWSGTGKDGKMRGEPVPGWTAERVERRENGVTTWTYQISACPRYIPDGSTLSGHQ